MKKIIKICLFIISILLPIRVLGACTTDDKLRYSTLASNITTSYDYVENTDSVTFAITIHNVHKELLIKDNANNKTYSSNNNSLNNFTITNLKDGTNYSFGVYAKASDCSYRLFNTLYINLPKYNKYYKDPLCEGLDNFSLCQRWGENGNITYDTFKTKVEEYKKKDVINDVEEIKKDETSTFIEQIGNFWAKYYLYITLGIIITLLPIIIVVNKKNSYDF